MPFNGPGVCGELFQFFDMKVAQKVFSSQTLLLCQLDSGASANSVVPQKLWWLTVVSLQKGHKHVFLFLFFFRVDRLDLDLRWLPLPCRLISLMGRVLDVMMS